MADAREIGALRYSVAIAEEPHVCCVRVSGPDAFDVADHLSPAELFVVDGQMRHTLLLHDDGRPLADVLFCCDDEDFVLLAEGPTTPELMAYIRDHLPEDARDVELEDLEETHAMVSLHGPYAWELMAELEGPEVIGVPYLTFFHSDAWTCFRAGKTGEYGYHLLVPSASLEEVRSRIEAAGRAFGLGHAGLEALDQCALENWFFNIRREGQANATPIELQLQWRVSYRKDYVGSEALKTRRREGPRARLTTLVGEAPMAVGDRVMLDGRPIGSVVNAGYSLIRRDWIGLALIDLPWAQPGIERYHVEQGTVRVPVRTVAPPVIRNRSLYVDPREHTYALRHEQTYPPLVEGVPEPWDEAGESRGHNADLHPETGREKEDTEPVTGVRSDQGGRA